MKDRLMTISKIFFFLFLFFTITFVVVYSIFDEDNKIEYDDVEYIESWTVTDAQGKSFVTGRHFIDNKVYDGDFTITAKLPEHIGENKVLCFVANIQLDLYINGKLRRSIAQKDEFLLPAGNVKSFYLTEPLTEADAGGEVKVIRNTPSNRPEVVPEAFVSTMNGVCKFLFERYGISFCLSIVLLAFSVVIILLGIGMMIWYRRKIDMLFGAFGIFIVASWLVTNSYLYPFVFGHYHIDGIANYLCCLMIPFGFVIYLDSLQNGRYRKAINVILIASCVNAILWTVLNFTAILPFVDALFYIDIILAILLVAATAILLIDIKKGKASGYKYTLIGFLCFLFFCALVLFSLTFIPFGNDDILMLSGLSLLLVFVVIQQVYDLRNNTLEKQKAIDLSDAKSRFLASMSHEIRTPINSILGMNEIIIKENKDEVIDHYSKTIRSSGRMLLTLVNDVLDFSKIEAGKIEIVNEEYSLSKLFSDILPMLAERAESKSLDFRTEIKTEIPDGQIGDEYRIKQIVTNLISNAIKYTDKGKVDIILDGNYTEKDRFNLKLSVKDTGRGIKKEDIDDLFDAFSRVDSRRNSDIEGTGLGLAIVKSIVTTMGGDVSVESEYGKGSVFTVNIPVGVCDSTPVKKDFSYEDNFSEETYVCDFTSDAKVLAVDDNKANLTIVKLFLKDTGIEPDLCISGTEAVEMCKKNKYDLILLDHMMPEPDGIETLKLIKENVDSKNHDTTCVVLTANAIAGSREMYINAGFADYLIKPIDSKKLIKSVKKLLPPDKIHEKISDKYFIEEFAPVNEGADGSMTDDKSLNEDDIKNGDIKQGEDQTHKNTNKISSLEEKMVSVIPDFDYEDAMRHCAGEEELLLEILHDTCNEHEEKINRMRKNAEEKKYEAYMIDAHSMKSILATCGIMSMSGRAKKHELAVKEGNYSFVDRDYASFLDEYDELCKRINSVI